MIARAAIVAAMLLGAAAVGRAQTSVSGVVRDSATGAAVTGAIVSVQGINVAVQGATVASVRTDEAGEFRVRDIPTGPVRLVVRRIGYREIVREIALRGGDNSLTMQMVPNAQRLAPVRVGAKGEGIYGVVASSIDLKPIAGARVMAIGSSRSVLTDSAGEYFIDLRRPGQYVLHVTANGFGEDIFPLVVKNDHVVDASRLLDVSNAAPIPPGMWKDFDERARLRANNSALATGSEVRRAGAMLLEAIPASPSVLAKGLKLGRSPCVFINGIPKPGFDMGGITPDDVEVVEVYGNDPWDRAVTELKKLWPRNISCAGMTNPSRGIGQPRNDAAAATNIGWVVIWMKR